jgi:hypothetical protein
MHVAARASAIAAATVAALLSAGCQRAEEHWSCEQQEALVARLQGDALLQHAPPGASVVSSYSSYPCNDRDTSLITVGRLLSLDSPVSLEQLHKLVGNAVEPGQWNRVSDASPTTPGAGGQYHVCYVNATPSRPREFLQVHASATAQPDVHFELTVAPPNAEMCRY